MLTVYCRYGLRLGYPLSIQFIEALQLVTPQIFRSACKELRRKGFLHITSLRVRHWSARNRLRCKIFYTVDLLWHKSLCTHPLRV